MTDQRPAEGLVSVRGAADGFVQEIERRKQWPLERVTVHLRYSSVHAEDCAACETRDAMLTVIERDLTLDGPLSEDQRARLLAIANRCPVHLTLTSKIDIRTTLR